MELRDWLLPGAIGLGAILLLRSRGPAAVPGTAEDPLAAEKLAAATREREIVLQAEIAREERASQLQAAREGYQASLALEQQRIAATQADAAERWRLYQQGFGAGAESAPLDPYLAQLDTVAARLGRSYLEAGW